MICLCKIVLLNYKPRLRKLEVPGGSDNRPFLHQDFQLPAQPSPDKMLDDPVNEPTPGAARSSTIKQSDRLLRQGDVDMLMYTVVLLVGNIHVRNVYIE